MTNGDDARAPEAGGYASVNGLEMYYDLELRQGELRPASLVLASGK
jgi:hypothetical protein